MIPFSIWVIGRENRPWAKGLSFFETISFNISSRHIFHLQNLPRHCFGTFTRFIVFDNMLRIQGGGARYDKDMVLRLLGVPDPALTMTGHPRGKCEESKEEKNAMIRIRNLIRIRKPGKSVDWT